VVAVAEDVAGGLVDRHGAPRPVAGFRPLSRMQASAWQIWEILASGMANPRKNHRENGAYHTRKSDASTRGGSAGWAGRSLACQRIAPPDGGAILNRPVRAPAVALRRAIQVGAYLLFSALIAQSRAARLHVLADGRRVVLQALSIAPALLTRNSVRKKPWPQLLRIMDLHCVSHPLPTMTQCERSPKSRRGPGELRRRRAIFWKKTEEALKKSRGRQRVAAP